MKIVALDSGYWNTGENMTAEDVAGLLVKLYADYQHYYGSENDDYARAVAIAIRMLSELE